jgi:hypothetical protein
VCFKYNIETSNKGKKIHCYAIKRTKEISRDCSLSRAVTFCRGFKKLEKALNQIKKGTKSVIDIKLIRFGGS